MISEAIISDLSRRLMLAFSITAACLVLVFFAGRASVAAPACECPAPESMPFCQVMGSPVGGRMAQLPEGYGPHD